MNHHREFKFQQKKEGPLTEEKMKRKEAKELRKEQRHLDHTKILEEYKKNVVYYDKEAD